MELEPVIRRATVEDLADVIFIARVSVGAPQWSDRQYEEILRASSEPRATRIILVAEMRTRLAGFCVASTAVDEATLESVVVVAEMRRQGLAKRLCQQALAWAVKRGAQEVWLEVRQSNIAARSLYLSIGFMEDGKRPSYYAQPKEDAVMMRALLNTATLL